ncbi:MAG: phosphoribosylamine--glycine ligase [Spirochaetales bacterium]|nr:phosphoribosylamine--glycine ligase [Spirochaetales bacterium]
MKVLVVGSGAREHAVTWLLSKSKIITSIYIAEGNAGTALLGRNLTGVSPLDAGAILAAIKEHQIDWVVVGPEAPCAEGVVDAIQEAGIPVFGPNQSAAQLESSKLYSKQFLKAHKIPTAAGIEFFSAGEFESYILSNRDKKMVIKKNGLAAGKGVLESSDTMELIDFGKNVLHDDSLLVEEFLEGWETSVFALTDGKDYKLLLPCADYKKANDGDIGPNTGGMGSVCPVPKVDGSLMKKIENDIVAPTFAGLEKDGIGYKGIVYFGIMVTKDGPKVLEYNIRFGDPEAQVLLPLIKTDFGEILKAIFEEKLGSLKIEFHKKAAVTVVVAADGYPGNYEKGIPVMPIEAPDENEAVIFHASTYFSSAKDVFTGGGRCFTVSGFGKDLKAAAANAYKHIDKVRFIGAWYRKDIGRKFYN